MRKLGILLLAAIVLTGIAGAALELWLLQTMQRPGPNDDIVRVHIAPGTSVRGALAELADAGVLESPSAVEWYLRLHRVQVTVHAGNYDIPAHATPRAILDQFAAGRVVLEQLTIVEGWKFADMRRAVTAHPRIRNTIAHLEDEAFMEALGFPGEHPEGRFFPDTYRFADGTTDREIYTLAHEKLATVLEEAWEHRQPDLPLANAYEALILASIIEKETALESERRRIAGVFIARLRQGMRLQTDPTVIYGLGDGYDGNIRRRDLTTDTPYNTYTREGLPPTPIALAGREAIEAAVNPDETGELYFVATGLGDGSHEFSRTLEQHNAAVARYLARLRQAARDVELHN